MMRLLILTFAALIGIQSSAEEHAALEQHSTPTDCSYIIQGSQYLSASELKDLSRFSTRLQYFLRKLTNRTLQDVSLFGKKEVRFLDNSDTVHVHYLYADGFSFVVVLDKETKTFLEYYYQPKDSEQDKKVGYVSGQVTEELIEQLINQF